MTLNALFDALDESVARGHMARVKGGYALTRAGYYASRERRGQRQRCPDCGDIRCSVERCGNDER